MRRRPGRLGLCRSTRIDHRAEGLRFSPTELSLWAATEGCLGQARQLHNQRNRIAPPSSLRRPANLRARRASSLSLLGITMAPACQFGRRGHEACGCDGSQKVFISFLRIPATFNGPLKPDEIRHDLSASPVRLSRDRRDVVTKPNRQGRRSPLEIPSSW